MRPFSKLWVLEKDTAETADDFAYYAHLIYDPCRSPRREADDGKDDEAGGENNMELKQ